MSAIQKIILALALIAVVGVPAAAQEVYFVPQQSSAAYCNTIDVQLWINATTFDLKSGQINITYGPTCANVTDFTMAPFDPALNITGLAEHRTGSEWITFYTEHEYVRSDFLLGTLTIHCTNDDLAGCETPLQFEIADPAYYSALFDKYGNEMPATWENGTFTCIGEPPPIPELPTIALFGLGLLALTGYMLRKST